VEVHSGIITESFGCGTVTGVYTVGGLVGKNSADVIASYSNSRVVGTNYVGGLVGYCSSGDVSTSYCTGTVTGNSYVGGLAGYNLQGNIADSYCTAGVSGHDNVGGLVGYYYWPDTGFLDNGSITACYSAGAVSGNTSVGGLIGAGRANQGTANFWDIETSGQAASLAGTGKTTVEMQRAATFLDAGWDFTSTWSICEGKDYPRLQWEGIDCNE